MYLSRLSKHKEDKSLNLTESLSLIVSDYCVVDVLKKRLSEGGEEILHLRKRKESHIFTKKKNLTHIYFWCYKFFLDNFHKQEDAKWFLIQSIGKTFTLKS